MVMVMKMKWVTCWLILVDLADLKKQVILLTMGQMKVPMNDSEQSIKFDGLFDEMEKELYQACQNIFSEINTFESGE